MLRLILMPVVSGLIATGGMTAFLYAVNRTGWTNSDMVRAVGSLFTKSYHNALGVGLVVHFLNGVIFAAVYLHILSLLALSNFAFEIFVGGCLGFAQGFVVSWAIVRFAYRHPVETFQKADFKVALAHHAGHVIYGLLLGAMFGLLRMGGLDVSPGM
jgi:hypothetical protein